MAGATLAIQVWEFCAPPACCVPASGQVATNWISGYAGDGRFSRLMS